jgi:hypothetical protein
MQNYCKKREQNARRKLEMHFSGGKQFWKRYMQGAKDKQRVTVTR